MERKSVFILLSLIIILLSVIAGCNGVNDPIIPTRTYTSTIPPCPPVPIDTPNSLEFRKTILVVLIQPDPYYEFANLALSTIESLLPQILEPGDEYYILRTGIFSYDFDAALIAHGFARTVPRPAIPATPTNFPTPTQTNTPVRTPQSAVARQEATVNAERTAVAFQQTATQVTYLYNCAIQAWNESYRQDSADWEATRTTVKVSIATDVSNDISGYKNPDESYPTAIPNFVYESLTHATTIFDFYECGDDDRCFLLVFSDLSDPRPLPPDYVEADLTGVSVISVMYNCDPLFGPACKAVQDKWTYNFSFYHAYSPPLYLNGVNLETNLIVNLTKR